MKIGVNKGPCRGALHSPLCLRDFAKPLCMWDSWTSHEDFIKHPHLCRMKEWNVYCVWSPYGLSKAPIQRSFVKPLPWVFHEGQYQGTLQVPFPGHFSKPLTRGFAKPLPCVTHEDPYLELHEMYKFAHNTCICQSPTPWGWGHILIYSLVLNEIDIKKTIMFATLEGGMVHGGQLSEKYIAKNYTKCPDVHKKVMFPTPSPMGVGWGSRMKTILVVVASSV